MCVSVWVHSCVMYAVKNLSDKDDVGGGACIWAEREQVRILPIPFQFIKRPWASSS